MLSALIFDFDGIIVDTEPLHFQAFNQVLAPEGKSFSWEEYCEVYIGFDDRDAFQHLFKASGESISKTKLQELIQKKAVLFQELIHQEKAVPLPGAVELIQSISPTLPTALCSGALRSDILPILERLKIRDCFRQIVSAEDTSISKPDPAPYLLTCEKLHLPDPATAVAIEDTPAGILSAKAAGLKVLAITNSYDREFLVEADAITDSLEEVSMSTLEDLVL